MGNKKVPRSWPSNLAGILCGICTVGEHSSSKNCGIGHRHNYTCTDNRKYNLALHCTTHWYDKWNLRETEGIFGSNNGIYNEFDLYHIYLYGHPSTTVMEYRKWNILAKLFYTSSKDSICLFRFLFDLSIYGHHGLCRTKKIFLYVGETKEY